MRSLNVFTNEVLVAKFEEYRSEDGRPKYRFSYVDGVRPDQAISLTLPTSVGVHETNEVPLAFRQHFPEGARLLRLKRLGKIVDVSDDFGILSVVGQSMVGRVSVSPTDQPPTDAIPVIDLHDASVNGRQLFLKLLEDFGDLHGVSGVQEKFLGQGQRRPKAISKSAPRTLVGDKYILKGFDPAEFPALAENEYWTTVAARNCGLVASSVELSRDFSTLIVKRFDLNPDGSRLAIDEAGALEGFSNDQKYLANYEVLANMLLHYSDSSSLARQNELSLFEQLVFMVASKNGDAHLKNFAMLSGLGPARLAPAYDLVCTGAYVDQEAGEFENPAMALDNARWEKHWWSKESLTEFGRAMFDLPTNGIARVFSRIELGLADTIREMSLAPKSEVFESEVMPKMVDLWREPFSSGKLGEMPANRGKNKK